ncbi:MAG: hypothetical protein JRI36_09915 [Deltaproteobacteria bacterium]|nr:hypothetical protein [Deltaproteobacteria bacterium]
MKHKEYPDAMFNMRAMFYDETKKSKGHARSQKSNKEPKAVRELRANVKRHQRPLTRIS